MKNKANIITTVSCCLVVSLLLVLFVCIPDKSISEKENRSLALLPKFSADNLFSGEYTSDLADYISDQFPFRDSFVAVKAYSELALGKRENNGVIYSDNGVLIPHDTNAQNRIKENLETVKEFEKATQTSVCLGILPRTIDVFSEYLPKSFRYNDNSTLWNEYYNIAQQNALTAPNLYEPLCEHNNYYYTDHHYNTYGAYQTYQLLGEALHYDAKDLDFFTKEKLTDSFCGTSMRTSGFYFAKKDEITLLRYDTDTEYEVVADGKKIELYDFSKLESTDKYAVFLGGNHARVDIKTDEDKPKLLIIRDSFADSIAPFLALHYNLTLIDLRYFNDSIQQLVKDEGFDKVLILQSMDEFSQSKNISYLRMGAK